MSYSTHIYNSYELDLIWFSQFIGLSLTLKGVLWSCWSSECFRHVSAVKHKFDSAGRPPKPS